MQPLQLSHFTTVTSLGHGLGPTLEALREGRSGLTPCAFETVSLDTYVGEVAGVDESRLPPGLADFDCRNNRLAQLGLEQDGRAEAVARAARDLGRDRIGVFIGTSTSGILETELAYRRRDPQTGALPPDFCYETTHNAYSAAAFARRYCGLARGSIWRSPWSRPRPSRTAGWRPCARPFRRPDP
jgi:3-oxoacyl-[acyl-carrier-protein] synthase-1